MRVINTIDLRFVIITGCLLLVYGSMFWFLLEKAEFFMEHPCQACAMSFGVNVQCAYYKFGSDGNMSVDFPFGNYEAGFLEGLVINGTE